MLDLGGYSYVPLFGVTSWGHIFYVYKKYIYIHTYKKEAYINIDTNMPTYLNNYDQVRHRINRLLIKIHCLGRSRRLWRRASWCKRLAASSKPGPQHCQRLCRLWVSLDRWKQDSECCCMHTIGHRGRTWSLGAPVQDGNALSLGLLQTLLSGGDLPVRLRQRSLGSSHGPVCPNRM